MNQKEISTHLFTLQDLSYKDFQCKLMPTVDPNTVIGVRIPELRRFAKQLAKTEDVEEFMTQLPHQYYDENNLHCFLIEDCREFETVVALLDQFLPYVDNWATCDSCRPKILKKHLPELLPHIKRWMGSTETYTIRFSIGMLMHFYLDDAFLPEYLDMVAVLRSDEYYINMMIAWFFATALAKQYQAALPYIEEGRLQPWTHNKAIQKAVESYRITPEQKTYLKTLKIKIK